MNRYILQPEDSICVLPPDTPGQSSVIQVFCDRRTMMFFAIGSVERVVWQRNVQSEGRTFDALCFVCDDALLGTKQQVLVPETLVGFAEFRQDFQKSAPQALDFTAEEPYVKEACDHKGPHHH